jgi:FixJ family two-component response regulator
MNTEAVVYIVEDDAVVRDSLCRLVREMQLTPVPCSHAQECLLALEPTLPGCIVTDLFLPGMSGLELFDCLANRGLKMPLIMISGRADVPTCVSAMKRGVFDFLEKPFSLVQLRELILKALERDASERLAASRHDDCQQLLARLTTEERQVANRITRGYTNQQIAAELDLSVRTIQFRRSSLMKKLDVKTRAELVALMLRCDPTLHATGPAEEEKL